MGMSGLTLSLFLESHRLVYDVPDGIRRFPLHPLGGVGIGIQCESRRVMTQGVGERLHVHAVLEGQRGKGVPLWHNKDKSENPCIASVAVQRDTK